MCRPTTTLTSTIMRMSWSSKNGEEKIPDDSTMRAKITEWKPLWRRLKSLNK